MNFSAFLHKRLCDLLAERRIVVWYDPDGVFTEFLAGFNAPRCILASAADSILKSRRTADEVYRRMNEADDPEEARRNLLIYVPWKRGGTEEERRRDPFEVHALAGEAFGDTEDTGFESLARQAMPDRADEISRMFQEGRPSIALLDGLDKSQRYPVVREVLGTESPADVIAVALCDDRKAEAVRRTAGCLEEVRRLLEAEIGFQAPKSKTWKEVRRQLGTYVLISEFAFDLPKGLPDALSAVPKADAGVKGRILAACDRMRGDTALLHEYMELAQAVEVELRLRSVAPGLDVLGERDTFPFEEHHYLHRLVALVEEGAIPDARAILAGRRRSVWRNQAERSLVWTAAERCVTFLETADRIASTWKGQAHDLNAMVKAYGAQGGGADLDRCQRLFEHSAAECADDAELGSLLSVCRRAYNDLALDVQERFLDLVRQEGWPPEGVMRQTQVFDKHVAGSLEQREKVAYFLMDSLRFEMGRDLAEALGRAGDVEVVPVAATLPTLTDCGMAALMPNADGMLTLIRTDTGFVPALGTRRLATSQDRMRLLKEQYGDRFTELTLDDLLGRFKQHARKLEAVDLVVVRTQDPDLIGENLGDLRARKYLSDVIGDITTVAGRLVGVGFRRLVFCSDHGHVLLWEIPAGDVVSEPAGEWGTAKRRCRLGAGLAASPGLLILKAGHVGIHGDVEELAVPSGFKVLSAGRAYFHGGISLQEAIVPLVLVRATGRVSTEAGSREVTARYRSDSFTSRVIGLRLHYSTLFHEPLRVRVEAYDGPSVKAKLVGEAADCDARDETTHEIVLAPTVETPVPMLLAPDFSKPEVEIRVSDPESKVIWARLKLKNAMVE